MFITTTSSIGPFCTVPLRASSTDQDSWTPPCPSYKLWVSFITSNNVFNKQTARHHNISNNNLMEIVTKLAHCLLPAFRHVMYIVMLLVSQRWWSLIWSWRRAHCWSPSSPSSLPSPSTRSTPSRRSHCQQDEPSPGPMTSLTGSPTHWGTTWTNDGTVRSDDKRRYNEWKCCDYGDDIIMFSPWRCQGWVVSSP